MKKYCLVIHCYTPNLNDSLHFGHFCCPLEKIFKRFLNSPQPSIPPIQSRRLSLPNWHPVGCHGNRQQPSLVFQVCVSDLGRISRQEVCVGDKACGGRCSVHRRENAGGNCGFFSARHFWNRKPNICRLVCLTDVILFSAQAIISGLILF